MAILQGSNISNDFVIVNFPGKRINQYIYDKTYVYSIIKEKLLDPRKTEKSISGNYWTDKYILIPGKYLLIEANIDEIKNTCKYKCLTVLTKEDYMSNKRYEFPDLESKVFRSMYQYKGYDVNEWEEDIPNWIDLPCECMSESQLFKSQIFNKEEYKQPQEVEDKLSLLQKEDEIKKPIQLLIQKNRK